MVHVYGQAAWHDTVYIVANAAGLKALKSAAERALFQGSGEVRAFAADGEGYDMVIIRLDGDEEWLRLALPYSEDFAAENRGEAVWPWHLLERKC